MKISIIAARDERGGIAKNGGIPWHAPADIKRFSRLTSEGKSAVIMGRTTWESLPAKFRPLPWRMNIVMSRNFNNFVPAWSARSLSEAYALAERNGCDNAWVIGGAQIYAAAIEDPRASCAEITTIVQDFGCDLFMPELKGFELAGSVVVRDGGLDLDYQTFWRA